MIPEIHIRIVPWWIPLLLALTLPSTACTERLCKTDEACPAGEQCNPESGRCFTPDVDAGDAEADAGDAGDAGDAEVDGDAQPGCSQSTQCTEAAAPICDATDLECRGCQADPECVARDPARPICDGPACVGCTDSAAHCANPAPICDGAGLECRVCADHGECAARDAASPACDATAGCVECTDSALHCSGTLPICEPTTNLCRPCSAHTECDLAGGVCDVSSGACLDEAEVIYIDNQAPQCSDAGSGASACTKAIPCCTLQTGVDTASPGRTTILVADGLYGIITLQDTGEVWIIGQANAAEIVASFTPSPTLYLSGTTILTIENTTIRSEGGTGAGVECDGNSTTQPSLILHGNTLSGNAGGGVTATNCTVTMDANTLSGNAGGGVSLSSSDFTLTNNLIYSNGGTCPNFGGVYISAPGAIAEVWHNTIADNLTTGTNAAGIRCIDPVTIHSTIVHGNLNGNLSNDCVAFFSSTTGGDPGFVGGGDYHLAPGSPCIDQGDPASTLDHDIDGDPRPQGGGPDIGADERQ